MDAYQIAQDFLDRQGDATVAGDVEATMGFCDLPCTLETMDRVTVAKTEAEMRAICEGFIHQLRSQQVTHMVRTCQEAVLKSDDTLWATYVTRLVCDGKHLNEPSYGAFVILKLRDGVWKISTMQFAITRDNCVTLTLRDFAAKYETV